MIKSFAYQTRESNIGLSNGLVMTWIVKVGFIFTHSYFGGIDSVVTIITSTRCVNNINSPHLFFEAVDSTDNIINFIHILNLLCESIIIIHSYFLGNVVVEGIFILFLL